MAYYDNELIGDIPKGGLFITTFDNQGHIKLFGFERVKDYTDDYIHLYYKHLRSEEPGKDFHMNYDLIMKTFSGDWYDAADIYKEWALQQSWASKTIDQRDDIPEDIINHDARLTTSTTEIEEYDSFMAGYINKYQQEPHSIENPKLSLSPAGSWSIRDYEGNIRPMWGGIDYFQPLVDGTIPMEPPDGDLLTTKISELKDMNVDIMLVLAGSKWDIYEIDENGEILFNDSTDFYSSGIDYVITKKNGEDVYWINWLDPESDNTRLSAGICIGTDAKNIMDQVFVDNIERGIRRGARSMRLGSVVGGRFDGCWNESHGHPIGEGKWTHDRYVQLLQEINNLVESLGKKGDFTLSMENPGELYIPYLQLQYGRHGYYWNWLYDYPHAKLPLFNYVYHGRYIGVDNANNMEAAHDEILSRWSQGFMFTQANIPGYWVGQGEDNQAIFNFHKKLVKTVPKILRKAEILNPLEISGLPSDEKITYQYWDDEFYDFYINRVVYNVFKTTDDKIHYLFVNINNPVTSSPEGYTLNFDISSYDLEGDSFNVYNVINGQSYLIYENIELPTEIEFDIGGEDIVEFIVEEYTDVRTFNLNLNKGINLISIPLILEDYSINTIFEPIKENLTSIYHYYNNEWKAYHTNPDITSGLNELKPKSGYFIIMKNNSILELNGAITYENGSVPVIQLKEDWNLIGVQGLTDLEVLDLPFDYESLWKLNESNCYEEIFTGTLSTGKGYWVEIKGTEPVYSLGGNLLDTLIRPIDIFIGFLTGETDEQIKPPDLPTERVVNN
jgi:hypothetical protein